VLFDTFLYFIAPALLIVGLAFFFAFRRPAPREDRAGSPATTALLVLVGVCLILVGAAACVLAPYLFALHGYKGDIGGEPTNGVAAGFTALFVAIVLLGIGVFLIRTRRSPSGGVQEDR
jgi:multisubunit Na+/H+ antiporter MnhB subunit